MDTTTTTTTTTKSFKLANDGERDVRFKGEKLASVSSHHYQGPRQNRWTELSLYRTAGGTLVLWIVGRTQWQGESDRHRVVTCSDEDAVVQALIDDDDGQLGDLAKELCNDVGIEHERTID